MNGNPRTKWQRKGRLHIAKTLQQVADTACAAALGMDLIRQAAERIYPVTFPSGGIVVPPPPKVGVAQMQGGEIVVTKSDILKKFGTFKVEPIDLGRIDITSKNASFDILTYLAKKAEGLNGKIKHDKTCLMCHFCANK